jgi:hypothetical protein
MMTEEIESVAPGVFVENGVLMLKDDIGAEYYLSGDGICDPNEAGSFPLDEVSKVIKWLREHATPRKTTNWSMSSYGFKHLVEREHGYVCNGAFILGAAILQYKIKTRKGNHSPNAYFNISVKQPHRNTK